MSLVQPQELGNTPSLPGNGSFDFSRKLVASTFADGIVLSLIVKVANKNNVRFSVADFPYGEILWQEDNHNVVRFGGSAAKFVDELFQLDDRRRAGDEVSHKLKN